MTLVLLASLLLSTCFCFTMQYMDIPTMKFFTLDFSRIQALNPESLSAVLAYSLVMIFDIGGAMYGLANLGKLVQVSTQILLLTA